MKKFLAIAVCLSLCLCAALAEEPTLSFEWKSYTLNIISAYDRDLLAEYDDSLSTGITTVTDENNRLLSHPMFVRLQPAEGFILSEDMTSIVTGDFSLIDAAGKEYPATNYQFFSFSFSQSGFEIGEEQPRIALVFDMPSEAVLAQMTLRVTGGAEIIEIALADAPHGDEMMADYSSSYACIPIKAAEAE